MAIPRISAGKWKFLDHLARNGGFGKGVQLSTVDVPFEDLAELDGAWVTYWTGTVQQSMDDTTPARHAEWGQWTARCNSSRINTARELVTAADLLDRIVRSSAEIGVLKRRHDATDDLLLDLEQHGFIQVYLLDPDSDAPPVESTVVEAQKKAGSRPYRAYVAVTSRGRARTGGCAR